MQRLRWSLKSNVWVQWQIALVLKGLAPRLLCILRANRMCLNEINLWPLNLGLVLLYGRSTLQHSDLLLLYFLTMQYSTIAHCTALQPSGRISFIHRRSLGSTTLWSTQEAEYPSSDHTFPAKSTLSSLVQRLSSVSKCFLIWDRDVLTLMVFSRFECYLLIPHKKKIGQCFF